MAQRVLITGGAGFIGSHLTDKLLEENYRVRILDALVPQVHGKDASPPSHLNPRADLVLGDVRDPSTVDRALDDVDIVFHLAAAVGVGQSMYQVAAYSSTNVQGTATLLEGIIEHRPHRLIIASSMSIYGEGLYRDARGRLRRNVQRRARDMGVGRWEPLDEFAQPLRPVATPETKEPCFASVYALNKFDQERMCLLVGDAYRIPTVALRFFNAYGPRQALSNPYTGVLAIFAARLLNGNAPHIYEDGNQLRDFIHVRDIVQACILAIRAEAALGHAINVGSGMAYSVRDVADALRRVLGRTDIVPTMTKTHRAGDIRHCYADISLAKKLLSFAPAVSLTDGLQDLTHWLQGQRAVDTFESAHHELASRGLSQ